jgi:hypothetical protein
MSIIIKAGDSGNLLSIDGDNQAKVKLANPVETNGSSDPNKVGSVRLMCEVDAGTITGTASLRSPYIDSYSRIYTADSNLLESEYFSYTAQNTGKFIYTNTTMTTVWTAAGMATNGSSITTTTTGVNVQSRAFFQLVGGSGVDFEISASFTNQPTTNTIIDFGLFINGGANPFTPTDGIYFRLNSSGLFGVVNSGGSETTTSVFNFTYNNNQKYKFGITYNVKWVSFWINDILYGRILTPDGQGQPVLSSSLPFAIRHVITGGAAGAVIQFSVNSYSVISSGSSISNDLSTIGNRVFGSYQGLSGGTMGSLANYANNTNPTPAVPTNTTSTVLTGLGGQGWETDTLAVNTDGIIQSYQNPAHTTANSGRRLVIYGVKIEGYIQTVLTGGGYNAQFALCFGHTAVSLATAESATTKAPRRIALGSHTVAANAAALTQLTTIQYNFKSPIYVNPGEFIAIARKKVGTAPSAGTIGWTILFDYGWE